MIPDPNSATAAAAQLLAHEAAQGHLGRLPDGVREMVRPHQDGLLVRNPLTGEWSGPIRCVGELPIGSGVFEAGAVVGPIRDALDRLQRRHRDAELEERRNPTRRPTCACRPTRDILEDAFPPSLLNEPHAPGGDGGDDGERDKPRE